MIKEGDVLHIDLSPVRGPEFGDLKDKVSALPGRVFDWDTKLWKVEATPAIADRLMRTIRPEVEPELLEWITASKTQAEADLTTPLPPDADLQVPWATERCAWQPAEVNDETFEGLLDYQRSAADLMATNKRAILGDDMGLGKTLTALSAVEEHILRNPQLADGPRLVVAPNSVLGSWVREIKRWLPPGTPHQVVDASNATARHNQLAKAIDDDAWCIVNWEQLRVKKEKYTIKRRNGTESKRTRIVMKEPLFQETNWLAVIADEVHKAKNRKSQQAQGLWRVQAPVMYGLTGTAIMNSPDELWSILRWLWPNEYHEQGEAHKQGAIAYWPFYLNYVDFWEDWQGRKVVTGVKNPDALRFAVRGKIIRRTVAGVLGDKIKGRRRIYYPVPLNPGQKKLYEEAERALWLEVKAAAAEGNAEAKKLLAAAESGDASTVYRITNGAARFVRLQQILESPAVLGGPDDSAILDDLTEKVEDSQPNQWTVMVKYKITCDLVKRRLEKLGLTVAIYNGDVSRDDRVKIEDAFQRGDIDVVVGTIDAMFQGITLTRGHLQYWVSRSVVPDVNEQGEARHDRLGQQSKVIVYIPQPPNTVSADKVETINRLKEGIVRAVLPKDKIEEVQK